MSGCIAASSGARIYDVTTAGAATGTNTECNSGYGLASATTCILCTDATYKGSDGTTTLVN
jgi:hypothetical protein